jgi:uncharacterized membrane protein required for colicin V production
MSLSEISLLVAALLPIIYRGWNGWQSGATTEMRHLLAYLFGALVAVHFWQPLVEAISPGLTIDPRWVAIGAFAALFAAGALVAAMAVNIKAKSYKSVKGDVINSALGAVAGAFSGALLGGSILWLATVATPGSFNDFSPAKALVALPQRVFRSLESGIAGISPGSESRARFPEVTIVEVPAEAEAGTPPAGAIFMQRRGQIAWR